MFGTVRRTTLRCPFLSSQSPHAQQVRRASKGKRRGSPDDVNLMSVECAIPYLRASEAAYSTKSLHLALRLKLEKSSVPLRGSLTLPRPLPTRQRIAVFATTAADREAALRAGASVVGAEDLVSRILDEGRVDFDKCLATVDAADTLFKRFPKLARTLGPKGLMPNAKRGTVVRDIGGAIGAATRDVDYRQRSGPVVRLAVARTDFSDAEIAANVEHVVRTLTDIGARGTAGKGKGVTGIDQIVLSSTHGPGIPLLR